MGKQAPPTRYSLLPPDWTPSTQLVRVLACVLDLVLVLARVLVLSLVSAVVLD